MSVARPGKIIGIGRNYGDHAAELGNAVPAKPLLFLKPASAVIGDPHRLDRLEVLCRLNGVERQHGRARDMVFSIPALVAYVSQVMTLERGDLIATGTPAGVGPLRAGDVVEVEIPGVGLLSNPVTAEAG